MSFLEKYPDLKLRLLSGAVLVLVGGTAIFYGDLAFLFIFVLLSAVMAWEVLHLEARKTVFNAVIPLMMALSMMAYVLLSWPTAVLYLAMTIVAYWFTMRPKDFALRACMLIAIFLGIIGLIHLRFDLGLIATIWVLACVVASDVGGYFVGRSFGGPKLWPSVSPKKTWSGTIGGWILAAMVGMYFSTFYPASFVTFAFYGVIIACFAQAGDLVESVLKRRAGVKDSSNLIPGHGGFLDRFDGVMGASLLIFFYVAIYQNGIVLG